ncbi:MAG: hypothetical protein N0C90_21475, partial [Candidatus Thiodiazotropha endolucinida]|nr:hypothetical protein [Candidatus Thiodiazotropha taylori]MCW4263926.1 hypothetical protein [Candidatus Thiodiazotropha endolucinida]
MKEDISKYFSFISTESDYILWFSLNKSFANTNEDIIFGAVYVPPENSRFLINDELMILEMEITQMCSKYNHVVLTGDFNGRTSNACDYLPSDTFIADLFDFDSETETFFNPVFKLDKFSVPRDRRSKDTKINNTGYKLLEICKNNNLFIVNGRLGRDRQIGNFSFRNTSVIDYCIISSDMFELYQDFEIIEMDPLFSDGHCLLRSVLKFSSNLSQEEPLQQMPSKRKWQPDKLEDFTHNIDCTKIRSLQHILQNNSLSKETINYVTGQIA